MRVDGVWVWISDNIPTLQFTTNVRGGWYYVRIRPVPSFVDLNGQPSEQRPVVEIIVRLTRGSVQRVNGFQWPGQLEIVITSRHLL